MIQSHRKLGIIAGGGNIPKMLIDECLKRETEFTVLAIEGNADKALFNHAEFPYKWIRLGQAGTGFKYFKEEKVQDVVMIGTIRRPSFFDLVPDLRTTAFFAKVGAKALGDDGLLRAVVSEIEKDGMRVKGIHEVMPELLIKQGVFTKRKPTKKDIVDIKRGVEAAYALGKLDIGQSVVVQQGIVLGVEGIEGTDELIFRCHNYRRKGGGGVLVKLRKPEQDMRIDLPTIGPRSIERAHESELEGIVVHAGNGLIVDEKETVALADKYGMFIVGVNPDDYCKEA
ncbi:MAG: UDP-2,3-diacylglucosamine diphosphatase LpxI [Alphaproteobacteria bacterium]|nr:UDP-2,3-diacylglucosamine diphosphatase LpxI [Alphaproteobacteria bacterium]